MSKKVLIIEDNEQDQKIMKRFLSKAGFEDIKIADSGEKGIEHASTESPDLIIVDTMLPGIDGFETCSQIKNVKRLNCKVIMMTGRIDAVDADKARKMGADDYCVKTSDYADLIESARKFFGLPDAGVVKKEEPAFPVQEPQSGKKEPFDSRLTAQWGIEKTNQAIRTLYKELEKKNEELKELDKLKSEFVAMVSHELRTPLTIIKGAIGQIADGIYGEVNEEQKKKLAMALKGTDSLRRMIDDILDLSKLEAKALRLNKQSVNLVDIAKEIHASFLSLAQGKGLELKVTASKEDIEAELDRDRITQVFTNLVGNALKFTDRGSIHIHVAEGKSLVECSVADTGPGISEENLSKVFNKFEQFGKTSRPGQEGTGLGLAICKNIVELHDGNIFVSSQVNKGTKFTFTLPKS